MSDELAKMNELAKIGYAEYAASERRYMRTPEEWESLPAAVQGSFEAFTAAVASRAIAATRLHDQGDDEQAGCGCPCHTATLSGICGTCCTGSQPHADGGQWMQIGFFGRIELEGYVTEITVGGQPVFHIDLPDKIWGGNPFAWEEYAASALHNRRPRTEQAVRKAWEARIEAARRRAAQEAEWERQQQERSLEAAADDRDDNEDDGEQEPF